MDGYARSMETLVANISADTRRERLKGRFYVVAPVTMIAPGVLNGSKGPLLYEAKDIATDIEAWNVVPLLLGHPEEGSGRTPIVLEKQVLGTIFNVKIVDDKLVGEAWFDEARAKEYNPVILFNLRAKRKMEISTGLGVDAEKADEGASYNGKPYTAVARNYRPDHLAVLVKTAGACSINDGCGIFNSKKRRTTMNDAEKKTIVDKIIKNSCCWDEDDREVLNALAEEKLTAMNKDIDDQANKEAVHNAAVKGFTDPGGNTHTYNEEKKEWETKEEKKDPPPKKKDPVENEEKPTLTPEQEAIMDYGKQRMQEDRDEAIETITKNESNKLTEEQLKNMSLDVLQSVANSLPKKEEKRKLNYGGAAGVTNRASGKEKPKPLGTPVMEFAVK